MKNVLTITLLFLAADIFAQKASDGSSAYTFAENNNHVMALQKEGGNAAASGDVKVEFYGHMAFKITSPKGLTVLVDPWRNDPTGTFGVWYTGNFPAVAVDVVLCSHAHFDHDAIYAPHATMALDRLAGEFKLGDVKITGVADKHQCVAPGDVKWDQILRDHFHLTNLCPPDNSASWDNVIYVVETGGLRIGFWGDNRPDPGPEAVALLKGLDVLVMNIDGSQHILSYVQINSILSTFQPKAVIPGHYLSGTEQPSSSLKNADEWVATQRDASKLTTSELLLNAKMLSDAKGRVYYFGNHVKTN